MNAVIYARYSSEKQDEQSIDGQLRVCQQFCKQQGYTIIGTYVDRALSASHDVEKRTEFQHMIHDAEKHLFELVVVYKLDRFARSRYDSATYKARLKKHNVRVVSATENISDSPEGIILESVLEGMAEFYSRELAQKVTRGMYDRALKAQSTGGTIPLGYMVSDKKLVIDPIYAPIVKEAFQLYADGISIKEICNIFNKRGLRTKKGVPFSNNSFKTLFPNQKYIGTYIYNNQVKLENAIPAIVEKEVFDRVQARLSDNKKAPARGKALVDYILTLKLFCGECKMPMVGESAKKEGRRYNYYACSGKKRFKKCAKKNVPKEALEQVVAAETKKLLTLENIDLIASKAVAHLRNEEQRNTTLQALTRDFETTVSSIANCMRAIEMGAVSPTLATRLSELEKLKSDLEVEIEDEKKTVPNITKGQIVFWLSRFTSGNIEDKVYQRQIIDLLVNSVHLYEESDGKSKVIITYNLTSDHSEPINGSYLGSIGDPSEIRTPDTLIKSQVLCQLS